MTSTGDLLATATAALAQASPAPLARLTDGELMAHLAEVEDVGRLVDALRVAAAAEVAHRSRRSLGGEGLARRQGFSVTAHLLENVLRVSQAEAARRMRIGGDLRPDTALDGSALPPRFPAVVEAVERGEIGIEAAFAITKNLGEALNAAPVHVVADAETQLVHEARHVSADLVAGQAAMWRAALHPDGSEPRLDRIHEKRRFAIGRTGLDGLTPFSGLAEPVFAAALRAAIGERTSPSRQPRFLDPADETRDDPDDLHPFAGDGRTREQRAYDVLEGLVTAGMRADRENIGPLHSTASVSVVVRASDLDSETGPAWLDDVREPITAALAGALACDAGIQLIAVGATDQPLWLGRRERYFTAAQRKALAVRDGGCVFPGCGAPPSWCHGHHVVEWSRGGPTDVDNGVLLCGFHHRLIHRGEWRLRMVRGRPELQSPRWVDPQQAWRPVGVARWQRAA